MTVARIWILGAGAVGSVLGGVLADCGHHVGFVGRKDAFGSPRRMRIGLPDRRLVAEAAGVKKAGKGGGSARPDFLFVCLGRNSLRELRRERLASLVDNQKTRVLFCNADPDETRNLQPPSAGNGCIAALLGAVKLQEGDVEAVSADPCLVWEDGSPAEPLAADFTGRGISVHTVPDIRPCMSSLFVSQLLFLPVALCNTTLAHFLSFPSGRRIAGMVLSEGFKAMEKCGKALARLPAMDPVALAELMRRNPSALEAARYLPDRCYPTILQAFLRGAPAEARELNKRIVDMASSAGLRLPVNWKLYQKAGRPAGLGFYRTPEDLERTLA